MQRLLMVYKSNNYAKVHECELLNPFQWELGMGIFQENTFFAKEDIHECIYMRIEQKVKLKISHYITVSCWLHRIY